MRKFLYTLMLASFAVTMSACAMEICNSKSDCEKPCCQKAAAGEMKECCKAKVAAGEKACCAAPAK